MEVPTVAITATVRRALINLVIAIIFVSPILIQTIGLSGQRSDHLFLKPGDQLFLSVIGDRFADPRKLPQTGERAKLFGASFHDRNNRDAVVRGDRLQLHRRGSWTRNLNDDERAHASQQSNCLDDVPLLWRRKVKNDRSQLLLLQRPGYGLKHAFPPGKATEQQHPPAGRRFNDPRDIPIVQSEIHERREVQTLDLDLFLVATRLQRIGRPVPDYQLLLHARLVELEIPGGQSIHLAALEVRPNENGPHHLAALQVSAG